MMARLPWPLVRLLLRPAAKNRMPTDDRRILEDIILRDIYGQAAIRRMLFVGCHQYSRWYPGLFRFRARTRIETVDPDPDSRAFGAPVHHQMPFQHLERDDTLRGQFDFIMVNGVFGYGINSDADKRSALDAAKGCFVRTACFWSAIGLDHMAISTFEPRDHISLKRPCRASQPLW